MKNSGVILCALQRETLLRRHGTQKAAMGTGPAAQHCMLRSIRDDALVITQGAATNSERPPLPLAGEGLGVRVETLASASAAVNCSKSAHPHPRPLSRRAGEGRRSVALAATTLLLAACGNASEAPSRSFDRDAGAQENLPFSAAVVVGDTIYLSGQIGRKPGETALVEGGVSAETRQIFENYESILERNGASLADIVKCTVFLEDMADYAAMNAAYAEAFPGEKPARSTLGADGLAFNAAVEIECLAIRGGR